MLNIGAGEIAVIMVVALLILGPKRLPELARGIGKFLREFRRQTDEVRTTIETEFYRMDRELQEDEPRKPTPLPTAQPAASPATVAEIAAAAAPAPTAEVAAAAAPAPAPNVVSGAPPTPREESPTAATPLPYDASADSPGKWEE